MQISVRIGVRSVCEAMAGASHDHEWVNSHVAMLGLRPELARTGVAAGRSMRAGTAKRSGTAHHVWVVWSRWHVCAACQVAQAATLLAAAGLRAWGWGLVLQWLRVENEQYF